MKFSEKYADLFNHQQKYDALNQQEQFMQMQQQKAYQLQQEQQLRSRSYNANNFQQAPSPHHMETASRKSNSRQSNRSSFKNVYDLSNRIETTSRYAPSPLKDQAISADVIGINLGGHLANYNQRSQNQHKQFQNQHQQFMSDQYAGYNTKVQTSAQAFEQINPQHNLYQPKYNSQLKPPLPQYQNAQRPPLPSKRNHHDSSNFMSAVDESAIQKNKDYQRNLMNKQPPKPNNIQWDQTAQEQAMRNKNQQDSDAKRYDQQQSKGVNELLNFELMQNDFQNQINQYQQQQKRPILTEGADMRKRALRLQQSQENRQKMKQQIIGRRARLKNLLAQENNLNFNIYDKNGIW